MVHRKRLKYTEEMKSYIWGKTTGLPSRPYGVRHARDSATLSVHSLLQRCSAVYGGHSVDPVANQLHALRVNDTAANLRHSYPGLV